MDLPRQLEFYAHKGKELNLRSLCSLLKCWVDISLLTFITLASILVCFYSMLLWPATSSNPTHEYPLPSNRHHQSSGDCLEGKGENYQVCSVQYCVQQLCTVRYTHMNRLTVLWIGFCLTGPISLYLDSFLYCVLLCVVCMLRFVTPWGGPGGIEAYP